MRALDNNGLPVSSAFHADSGRGGGDWSSLSNPQKNGLPTDSILTKSETKIASGYVSGMIGKEIADKAGISLHTVVRHTQNIYEKTGIPHSTNALVAWFLSKNFDIDLSEFRRRVIAALLFVVVSGQIVYSDFDNQMVRRFPSRRIEVKGRKGRRRKEDDETYYL